MLLTSDTAIRYLIARDYLSLENVMGGHVQVAAHTSRNRGFQVRVEQSRGYWVKQPRDWNRQAVRSFRQEARWYWLVRNDLQFERFATSVPHCLSYDPGSEILVLELAELKSRDLHDSPARFHPDTAAQLGRTLASFNAIIRSRAPQLFPVSMMPWVFSLHITPPDPARQLENGQETVIRILREYPDFGPLLDNIRSEWKATALVHGDMKFENCLTPGGTGLHIIDWELAGWGDPCWDAAGILHAYWSDWVRGKVSLDRVRAASAVFWNAWRETVGLPASDELLIHTTRLTAARLIQSAWEDRRYSSDLSQPVVKMLQLSLNVLLDPVAAAKELIGN